VLLLYDGGMTVFDSASRWDLFEIIDDRAADRAPVIISQLPIEHWHAWDRRRQWLRPLLGAKCWARSPATCRSHSGVGARVHLRGQPGQVRKYQGLAQRIEAGRDCQLPLARPYLGQLAGPERHPAVRPAGDGGGWKSAEMVRRYAHLAPAQMARHVAAIDVPMHVTNSSQQARTIADTKKASRSLVTPS
jgi:hypothetical protein